MSTLILVVKIMPQTNHQVLALLVSACSILLLLAVSWDQQCFHESVALLLLCPRTFYPPTKIHRATYRKNNVWWFNSLFLLNHFIRLIFKLFFCPKVFYHFSYLNIKKILTANSNNISRYITMPSKILVRYIISFSITTVLLLE